MLKFRVLLTSCAFALMGVSAASAAVAYVDAKNGSNNPGCALTTPCATLNYALEQIAAGDQIIFLSAGSFGPVRLTGAISMSGVDPATDVQIVANPAASVGCIGAPAGGCGGDGSYAVEIAGGVNDNVKMAYLLMSAGASGTGALKFTSGGKIQLTHSVFRGNGTTTGPIVLLNPTNAGTTQSQVYFAYNDVAFNNSGNNAGAVLVQPGGLTSLKLHFNHVEVHNAAYGIRTDGSSLTSPTAVVASFISECEFFSFNFAAVNAFSTAGTGTVNAVFDTVRILNAQAALKANGPQSFVILTNNTVAGNTFGIQVQSGASVGTSQNNTVYGNGTDLSVTGAGSTFSPITLK